MKEISLFISEWDQLGRGLSRLTRVDGSVIWVAVPGSIVGELVSVNSLFKKGSGTVRHVATISSILQASSSRVIPRCSYAGFCGGCVWQHMSYDLQFEIKQKWITSLFEKLVDDLSYIRPIIRSEQQFEYRNKMEFSFSQDRSGTTFLGLFGSGGRVVSLHECHLVQPWVGAVLQSVHAWWKLSGLQAYHWRRNEGTLETLTVREGITTGDRMVILTVSGNPDFAPRRSQVEAFCQTVKQVAGDSVSIILRIRQIAPKRPTQLYDMVLFGKDHVRERLKVSLDREQELEIHIGPQSFFQPNTIQAQKIYKEALSLAQLTEDDVVFDLYCGIGVFGMFAAFEAQHVVGIELSRDAVYDATINAQRLGLGNFTVHAGDVTDVLRTMGNIRPDVVIVDPPRAGLQKAIEQINLLQPKKLVYVSCSPRIQSEDAYKLISQGWQIKALQPVDQFPHTPHVENIVLFERQR